MVMFGHQWRQFDCGSVKKKVYRKKGKKFSKEERDTFTPCIGDDLIPMQDNARLIQLV